MQLASQVPPPQALLPHRELGDLALHTQKQSSSGGSTCFAPWLVLEAGGTVLDLLPAGEHPRKGPKQHPTNWGATAAFPCMP